MRPEVPTDHAAFLRRLAARLVVDAAAADDVVADAWVVALERPTATAAPARSWLAGVVRNLARRRNRSDARRRAREAAAPGGPSPSLPPDELAAREETVRALVDAVFALPESSRSVVLLRYYEDLSLKQIAGRLGCPVDTARTRLKRAMARLRERMDARHDGDRRRWSLALAAAFRPAADGAAVATVTGGLLAMSTPVKFVLAAAVLVLAALPFVEWGERAPPDTATSPPPSPSSPSTLDVADRAAVPVAPDRAEASRDPAAPASGPVADAAWLARGRCVDGDGGAVAGAVVEVRLKGVFPERVLARTASGGDGRFTVDVTGSVSEVPWYQRRGIPVLAVATREGHRRAEEQLANDVASGRESGDVALVLERLVPRLHLRVFDAHGTPVEDGVRVAYVPDGELFPLEGSAYRYTWAASDGESGLVAPLPDEPGRYRVRVMVQDRGTGEVGPLDLPSDREATCPPVTVSGPGLLSGVVVTPDGAPVEGVRVAAHGSPEPASSWPHAEPAADGGLAYGTTTTDAAGRFELGGLAEDAPFHLSVQDAEIVGDGTTAHPVGTRGIRVVVERYVLVVHVTDEQGTPLPAVSLQYENGRGSSGVCLPQKAPVVLSLDDGGRWEFVASAAGRQSGRATVTFENTYRTECRIVLPVPVCDPGRLVFRITDDRGALVPFCRFALWPTDEESLTTSYLDARSGTPVEDLLPARYDVQLIPRTRLSRHPLTDEFFPTVDTTATIRPGETTVVELTVERQARIAITATADGVGEGERLPWFSVRWRPRRGAERTISHLYSRTEGGGARTSSTREAGTTYIAATTLPAGPGRLVVTASAHRTFERTLVLEAGRTTKVAVHLERE